MKVSALDEKGKPVDWWFIYKVPELSAGANSDRATGYEYVYYDANLYQARQRVAKEPYLLNEGKGALNNTLNSVFGKPAATTGWINYNDEMPGSAKGKDDANLGHSRSEAHTIIRATHHDPEYRAGPKPATRSKSAGKTKNAKSR